MRLSLIVFTILLFYSCSLTDNDLKEGWWKYGEGYHIEDVLDFKKNYTVNRDTLLQNGKKVGIIIGRTKSLLKDNRIEISSLDNNQSGFYYQK